MEEKRIKIDKNRVPAISLFLNLSLNFISVIREKNIPIYYIYII